MEMAFMDQNAIIALVEQLVLTVFQEVPSDLVLNFILLKRCILSAHHWRSY